MTKLEIINNILCLFICIMGVVNIVYQVYMEITLYKLLKKLDELKEDILYYG